MEPGGVGSAGISIFGSRLLGQYTPSRHPSILEGRDNEDIIRRYWTGVLTEEEASLTVANSF